MKKIILLLWVALALSGCASTQKDPAVQSVQNYLKALAAGDSTGIINYTCKEYEDQTRLDVDSFAGVKTTLKDVSCQKTGTSGNQVTVKCQGSIDATYGNEVQHFDLSRQSYTVVQQQGEWLVCGRQ